MGGHIDTAAHTCREYCDKEGLCVRLYESFYIYKDGSEQGFTVSFMNYPRFPSHWWNIDKKAEELGLLLMKACKQESFSIEGPSRTRWFSDRPEDKVDFT